MPVITAPADTITLTVDAQTIECQVTSHTLEWDDPTSGEVTRTGCGDEVVIPADSSLVRTGSESLRISPGTVTDVPLAR